MTPIHLRTERTGRVTVAGPVRMPPSVATLIARDIASIFFVPAVILIVVAWAAGDGLRTTPATGCFDGDCSGDAPRGDR